MPNLTIFLFLFLFLFLLFFLLLIILRSYMDHQVSISLNKGRKVTGTLRGYDQFMNLVLDQAVQEDGRPVGLVVIRGSSIVQVSKIYRNISISISISISIC